MIDHRDIIAITMPGFGTTTRTKNNAIELCKALGVTLKSIDIRELSLREFEAIEHNRDEHSVTYENVQARARTSILMNLANKQGGLVIGTGDRSNYMISKFILEHKLYHHSKKLILRNTYIKLGII